MAEVSFEGATLRRSRRHPTLIPSRRIEYAFYCASVYSMTAEVWGILIPIVAGLMVVGPSAVCIWKSRALAKQLYTPLACLIGCAISFVFTQVLIHEASLSDQTVRSFVIWILQLMLVYALCLRRNFSLRYPIVLFLIGLTTLPFLTIMPGEVERTRVDAAFGGNLASLGGLGEWLGFC